MNIFFSEEEQKNLLGNIGYTIETVPTYYIESIYHNDSIGHDTTVDIAYKDERPDLKLLMRDKYTIDSAVGIKKTFENELKKRIKELFK